MRKRTIVGEDYALEIVPSSARTGRFSLLMAFWAIAGALIYLVLGATVAITVGTVNALLGVTIASIFMGVITGLLTRHAARTGLTVAGFSQVVFGKAGAPLAALLLGGTALFYASFESSLIGVALSSYVGLLPLEAWYAIVAAYGILLAVGGIQKWLDRINGTLLPLYLIGLFGAFAWAISDYGFGSAWLTYTPERIAFQGPPLLFAVVTYLGTLALAMFAWDFARFGRISNEKFHSTVTFGPIFCILTFAVNGFIGIFLVLVLPIQGPISEQSLLPALIALMGIWGLIFVLISQTRINTANYYIASINVENLFASALALRPPRLFWLVVVGLLCFLLMLLNPVNLLTLVLEYSAVFVVAWVAIATTHVLTFPARTLSAWYGANNLVHWPGMGSWFISSVVGIVMLKVIGGVWAGWSSPITFGVACLGYIVWSRVLGPPSRHSPDHHPSSSHADSGGLPLTDHATASDSSHNPQGDRPARKLP